jgi:hypothetical protein
VKLAGCAQYPEPVHTAVDCVTGQSPKNLSKNW